MAEPQKTKRRVIVVIVIVILLVVLVALAAFAFGLFGTSPTPANLSIESGSAICWTGDGTAPLVGTTPLVIGECGVLVDNIGGTAGTITGAGPILGKTAFELASGSTTPVPANAKGVVVFLDESGTPLAAGEMISGYLTQSNGPNLSFTASVK